MFNLNTRNKRGGVWLYLLIGLILIIIIVISVFAYLNINKKKDLQKYETVLDKTSIAVIGSLKCAYDYGLENNGNVTDKIKRDCETLYISEFKYTSEQENVNELNIKDKDLTNEMKNKIIFIINMTRILHRSTSTIEIKNTLDEAKKFYDVNSITYDKSKMIITDLEITELNCTQEDIKVKVKLINTNTKINFIYLQLEDSEGDRAVIEKYNLPTIGNEIQYTIDKSEINHPNFIFSKTTGINLLVNRDILYTNYTVRVDRKNC